MLARGLLVASIAACSATQSVQAPPGPPTPRPIPALRQVAAFVPAARPTAAARPSFLDDPTPMGVAVATIAPIRGGHARGTITFRALADDSVEVVATIDNLPGPHTYRVHATGDCSAPDAASAGPAIRGGQLGELVDHGGISTTHRTTIERSLRSLVGRSIVIHAEARDDDHPAYAGRVACGVIEPAR